jgi:predicted flap endonuclease-1-like 5' DNA nuclease
MNDQVSQGYGAVAATAETGWLTTSFVLIALGAALAVFILIWGTRLAIRRRKAREELDERGELEVVDPAQPIEPVSDIPSAPEAPASTPEPGPLADEPIAAAAPVAVPSAPLAADTNAEPAPPVEPAPAEPAPAAGGDDLTRLKGVGPKLAARLNELGITRFAQLAALDEASAKALDAQLGSFQGRMTRDRWTDQARFLAAGDTAGYEAVFGKL